LAAFYTLQYAVLSAPREVIWAVSWHYSH